MPFFRAGIVVFSEGKTDAKYERIRHHVETKPNWMNVRVTGFGSVVRMSLEEVFVRADVKYQTRQRP